MRWSSLRANSIRRMYVRYVVHEEVDVDAFGGYLRMSQASYESDAIDVDFRSSI